MYLFPIFNQNWIFWWLGQVTSCLVLWILTISKKTKWGSTFNYHPFCLSNMPRLAIFLLLQKYRYPRILMWHSDKKYQQRQYNPFPCHWLSLGLNLLHMVNDKGYFQVLKWLFLIGSFFSFLTVNEILWIIYLYKILSLTIFL